MTKDPNAPQINQDQEATKEQATTDAGNQEAPQGEASEEGAGALVD